MSASFTKTRGWLDWYPEPVHAALQRSRPGRSTRTATSSAPATSSPYAPERKYTPCDASKEQLFALRDHLGVSRNVIVQATCHGADNSAMVDAVQAAGGRARGIATVRPDVTEAELRGLDEAGVRGVRFNFLQAPGRHRPTDDLADDRDRRSLPSAGTSSSTSRAPTWRSWRASSASLPTPLVVDHMGRPDVTQAGRRPGVQPLPALRRAQRRVGEGQLPGAAERDRTRRPRRRNATPTPTWCPSRAAPWRSSRTGCCGAPTGPTPTSPTTCPTTGSWSTTFRTSPSRPSSARKLLVDNPMRLYWPDERLSLSHTPPQLSPTTVQTAVPRAAFECGEPARPVADLPLSQGHAGGHLVRLLLRVRGHQHASPPPRPS